MGQFKPMVKMETTEPSVELKLKKGGSVSSSKKMMNGGVMGALSAAPSTGARGGMSPVARPGKPSMMDRRKAMMGKSAMARPMMAKGGSTDALEAHAAKPASKGHAGLKTGGVAKSPKPGNYATGGVVNGQGGFKAGGIIKSEKGGTKMDTAKVDTNSAPTGGVKLGNAGGYKAGGMAMVEKDGKMVPDFAADGKGKMKKGGKAMMGGGGMHMMPDGTMMNNSAMKKGGASKKHYATGGLVNSGRAVAMPQKPASKPVTTNRQSGTFKKGGMVKMKHGGDSQSDIDKAYADSIGPPKEDIDMAKSIRSIPGKLFRGAKNLMGMDKKPKAGAGSVTETEKSITVEPARKRGGSVKC